jgi:hypothetical protein
MVNGRENVSDMILSRNYAGRSNNRKMKRGLEVMNVRRRHESGIGGEGGFCLLKGC